MSDVTNPPTTSGDTPAHRYTAELAQDIELRWQDWWDEHHTFETPNTAGPLADADLAAARGEKLFVLDMFPYPSGSGLHVGHPLGFIGTDVFARFKRMTGHNVLHAMGFDAFGLPAEQFAVETGQHPAITTAENVATYRRQLRRLGLAHDPRRSVSTTDPEFYRWTQWIFSQVFNAWYDHEQDRARPIAELIAEFESGTRPTPDGRSWDELSDGERADVVDGHRLAYVSEAPVNWCPGLGTVVANEEVTADGRSDRGNFPVFKRSMRQWMMRITTYADRLIDDLELLDWTDAIKSMQRNWIGRSYGAEVHFPSAAGDITVFTTRPDTLFGASFMVLSPEHPFVDELTVADQADAIAAYREQASKKKEFERQDETREKTGVFTGSYATNPVNGDQIPVWIADYVLMGYGTGAIMAVPCGDQRDFEFARKFDLPIPAIQQPPAAWFEAHDIEPTLDTSQWPVSYVGDAPYVQSANDELDLNGVDNKADGIAKMNAWLEAHGAGTATINYKLRDWLFSRQRYWGEPFPIVYDVDGHPHTLPDDMLPVLLPETESFSPRTFDADDEFSNPESPLDRLGDWVEVELDLGDGPQVYRRDTNVMPQWAGSCWYEMRYLDPTNEQRFVDREVEEYWMGPRTDIRPDHPGGVDLYVGGVEHAVLHLLYSRFWHKVLYDLGHVSSKEPYARLFNQGYVQAAAYKDEREIYVDATKSQHRGRRQGRLHLRGQAGHPRVGQDGQEPEERRLARRHVRAVRRRHAAPVRDGDRSARRITSVGDARRRRHVPIPAASVAQHGRRGHRRVHGGRGAGRRRDPQVAAPHDRHRAHRDGRTALQHRDRQADRTEQRGHQARRHATRGGRADGDHAGAARAAHRRGAVARARPRRHDHLRRVPGSRPSAARRRHDRGTGADQRQGPRPDRRGRRRDRGRDRGGRARRRQDRCDRRRGDPEEGHRRPRPHGQHRPLTSHGPFS